MKKLILIFTMILMTLVSASAQDSALWRYVNTLDGKEPNGETYYFDDGKIKKQAWEGWGNICYVEMLVYDDGESVVGIQFQFTPGW